MPFYRYTILTKNGLTEKSEGFFHSEEALTHTLYQRDAQLLSHALISPKKRHLPPKEALTFLQTLTTLMEAGFSLLQAFEHFLRDQVGRRKRTCILHMMHQIQEGVTLDSALAPYFTPALLGIIRIGLSRGNLPEALRQAAFFMEKDLERQEKLKRAGVYPFFLLILFFIMIAVFTQMLLPQIALYLKELGVNELPFLTRALMAFAQGADFYGAVGGGIVMFMGMICVAYKKIPRVQKFLTPAFFKLPFIGGLLRLHFQNHWLFYTEKLYGSGLDFKSTLDFVQKSYTNAYLFHMFEDVHGRIVRGAPFMEELRSTKIFSPLALSLLQAGSQSGRLAEACAQAYSVEEKKYNTTLDELLKYSEPALLVSMGLFLLWIVLAVITPIYDHLVV